MIINLNPDWPVYDDDEGRWYNFGPANEIAVGFENRPTFQTAAPFSQATTPFGMRDIEKVTDYYLSSHGIGWEPGGYIGTELEFVIIGQLKDGRWFSGSLWNDYTGWGCGSSADFRVADTLGEIHQYGLDEPERNRLGIKLIPAVKETDR